MRILGLLLCLTLLGQTPQSVITESPTGRNPRFIWSAEWQLGWQLAAAQNHPWWKVLKANADARMAGKPNYADTGQWNALVYQITGDVAHGRKAVEAHLPWITTRNANHVRQAYVEDVLLYDWLLPVMTESQRAEWEGRLHTIARYCLGIQQPAYTGSFNIADSDQTTGQYFGLAMTDLALGTTYLNQTTESLYTAKIPVGGLEATRSDRSTVRNGIKQYCDMARGGIWIEGSDYNPNTMMLLRIGTEAIRSATGRDYFPESTLFFTDAKRAMGAEMTPDLKDSAQWSDEEHPRDTHWSNRGPMMLALGIEIPTTPLNLFARAFYLIHPYAARTPLLAATVHESPGVGALIVKSPTSLFWSLTADWLNVHHEAIYLNDFRLWHAGEWVVDHPIFNGPGYGDRVNSMLLYGLTSMNTQKGLLKSGYDEAKGYFWQSGMTGGPKYSGSYYNPPAAFLREWTRVIVYLPEYPAIVVRDFVDMTHDPKSRPDFTRFAPSDQTLMNAAPAPAQWILHTPVPPTIVGKDATWLTKGGQTVKLRTLLPAVYRTQVVDEATLPWGNVIPSEKKFHVKLLSDELRTTFLNVITVGTAPTMSLAGDSKLFIGSHTIEFKGWDVAITRR